MKIDNRKETYSKEFFDTYKKNAINSASSVIPCVLEFLKPNSVVDVGCGIGAWLAVWEKHGVTEILGIDGKYIDTNLLLIDKKYFLGHDLETEIELSKKFDLAMSLEVAEHIREQHAEVYIRSICNLSDVVLFSAAIPNQGGVLHYNEQYPEYWIKIFAVNGYSPYDCLREKIWNNTNVIACYRQNILFFARNSIKEKIPAITRKGNLVLPIVHPIHYESKQAEVDTYKQILKSPFHAGWFFMKKYTKAILRILGLRK